MSGRPTSFLRRLVPANRRATVAGLCVAIAAVAAAAPVPATRDQTHPLATPPASASAAAPALPVSPLPTATRDPGVDLVGRAPAATETSGPSPTPDPSPVCDVACSAIPVPAPESTPDALAAITFKLHVPVLEYHRIKPWHGETGTARDLITPPEIFSAQMDAMAANGWKTITMGELGEDLRFGITPDPKTFVVTFDDGYEDGYQNAFPALLSHGYVGTFFVIAQRIGWPGFLTPFELAKLVGAGNEIGNHSYSHRNLGLMTPDQLRQEINGASAIIANYSGSWPRSFAYPLGLGSAFLMDSLAACPGLDTAVIEGGSRPESWSIRWRLPRIRVGAGTYPSDLVKQAGWY